MADQGVILSVRGEARGRVVPDAAGLYAGIRVVRAHDYADALGVTVVAVEQIADAGLLGTPAMAALGRAAAGRAVGLSSVAALDPVPQELAAVIEARFRTSAATLTT